jgi:hypothetical protein
MNKSLLKTILAIFILLGAINNSAFAWLKGIYITEATLEHTSRITKIIEQAKATGINTFVIDFVHASTLYRENIKLVKAHGLQYIARIVVFPDGANDAEVNSLAYRESRYQLVRQAIAMGAQQIQLDYIRYASSQHPSVHNAQKIHEVIRWFRNKIPAEIPLQIDVFGVAAFSSSVYIGQDLRLFADTVDAVCPMVYPSHFEPFRRYARMPYSAVHGALAALRHQFHGNVPFKVYPYIETYNYRYPLSEQAKLVYIEKEIAAVEAGGANGWIFWNPHNTYENLFWVLKNRK